MHLKWAECKFVSENHWQNARIQLPSWASGQILFCNTLYKGMKWVVQCKTIDNKQNTSYSI